MRVLFVSRNFIYGISGMILWKSNLRNFVIWAYSYCCLSSHEKNSCLDVVFLIRIGTFNWKFYECRISLYENWSRIRKDHWPDCFFFFNSHCYYSLLMQHCPSLCIFVFMKFLFDKVFSFLMHSCAHNTTNTFVMFFFHHFFEMVMK